MIVRKLIGLQFVGSSMSPDLWIGIIITECFHNLGNTFVIIIDVLIMSVMYGIVKRLSLICCRLIISYIMI